MRHGSGFGLWLVNLIVDYLEGTVSYEETDPQGNLVTIELDSAATDHTTDA